MEEDHRNRGIRRGNDIRRLTKCSTPRMGPLLSAYRGLKSDRSHEPLPLRKENTLPVSEVDQRVHPHEPSRSQEMRTS
jgi:hypothetical protein